MNHCGNYQNQNESTLNEIIRLTSVIFTKEVFISQTITVSGGIQIDVVIVKWIAIRISQAHGSLASNRQRYMNRNQRFEQKKQNNIY